MCYLLCPSISFPVFLNDKPLNWIQINSSHNIWFIKKMNNRYKKHIKMRFIFVWWESFCNMKWMTSMRFEKRWVKSEDYFWDWDWNPRLKLDPCWDEAMEALEAREPRKCSLWIFSSSFNRLLTCSTLCIAMRRSFCAA